MFYFEFKLFNDKEISSKIGQVKEIFLQPTGRFPISSTNEGERRQANLNFIVKGTEKYIDASLQIQKYIDTDWVITDIKE